MHPGRFDEQQAFTHIRPPISRNIREADGLTNLEYVHLPVAQRFQLFASLELSF
jgi:hypothetical protein